MSRHWPAIEAFLDLMSDRRVSYLGLNVGIACAPNARVTHALHLRNEWNYPNCLRCGGPRAGSFTGRRTLTQPNIGETSRTTILPKAGSTATSRRTQGSAAPRPSPIHRPTSHSKSIDVIQTLHRLAQPLKSMRPGSDPRTGSEAVRSFIASLVGGGKPYAEFLSAMKDQEFLRRVHQLDLAELHAAARKMSLSIELTFNESKPLGRETPCIFVANHPKGIIDIASVVLVSNIVRSDAKFLVWDQIFDQGRPTPSNVIPIAAGCGDAAEKASAFRRARAHLKAGGDVFFMPAGGAPLPTGVFSRPSERAWSESLGLLASSVKCNIVPICVQGRLNLLPNLVRHLGGHAKVIGLVMQFASDTRIRQRVTVGEPLSTTELKTFGDRRAVVTRLREICCATSPEHYERPLIVDTSESCTVFSRQATDVQTALGR